MEAGMLTFHAPLLAVAVGALLLSIGDPGALARGSQVSHDDPWNSDPIDHLPPEVRKAVAHMCGNSPRAAHYFEYVRCKNSSSKSAAATLSRTAIAVSDYRFKGAVYRCGG
jgi:hypothetical protein